MMLLKLMVLMPIRTMTVFTAQEHPQLMLMVKLLEQAMTILSTGIVTGMLISGRNRLKYQQ